MHVRIPAAGAFRRWLWRVGLAGLVSAVAACSGGSGSSVTTDGSVSPPSTVLSAPRVVEAPVDQTVKPGDDATFSARAEGSAPLSFQWQRNGVDIPGATASTYTLPAASESDAGSRLRVVVRNGAGEAASSEATLRVEGAKPSVVRILSLGVVSPGQPLVITAALAGNPPFQYQWLRNGQPIEGASGSSEEVALRLGPLPLTAADDGVRFAVVVANAEGAARSSEAIVSVVGRQRLAAGASHSLVGTADGSSVWAWGANEFGQLGDGIAGNQATPVRVTGLTGAWPWQPGRSTRWP